MPACADLACLTSEMCLGGTPFERSQETIRLAARSTIRLAALHHSAGRGCFGAGAWRVDRGKGHLLLAVTLYPAIAECALVALGVALQVTSVPLL